jgi:hypothetical protein
MRHPDVIDEVAIETGRPRASVLVPVLGITDDAACAREQPKESVSTTKVTVVGRGGLLPFRGENSVEWVIIDLAAHRMLSLADLCPEVARTVQAGGRIEVTVTFTPESPK